MMLMLMMLLLMMITCIVRFEQVSGGLLYAEPTWRSWSNWVWSWSWPERISPKDPHDPEYLGDSSHLTLVHHLLTPCASRLRKQMLTAGQISSNCCMKCFLKIERIEEVFKGGMESFSWMKEWIGWSQVPRTLLCSELGTWLKRIMPLFSDKITEQVSSYCIYMESPALTWPSMILCDFSGGGHPPDPFSPLWQQGNCDSLKELNEIYCSLKMLSIMFSLHHDY